MSPPHKNSVMTLPPRQFSGLEIHIVTYTEIPHATFSPAVPAGQLHLTGKITSLDEFKRIAEAICESDEDLAATRITHGITLNLITFPFGKLDPVIEFSDCEPGNPEIAEALEILLNSSLPEGHDYLRKGIHEWDRWYSWNPWNIEIARTPDTVLFAVPKVTTITFASRSRTDPDDFRTR